MAGKGKPRNDTAAGDPLDEEILNVGLDFAMEFGENWLQPIQGRLGVLFPALSASDLSRYDAQCREAMNFGHRVVADVLRELGEFHGGARPLFSERMLSRYRWVSPDNVGRLFSQGCYYAMK
jgi:hypothetical protein